MNTRLKTLSALLVLVVLLMSARACPEICLCKWKNGKQTVECNHKNLDNIPEGMDPGTQVLEFSGNNLTTLINEKFLKMDLTNLQRIYLSRCKIFSVDEHTFKGLTNLVELDLSNNHLVSVPTESFVDCPALMKLTLNSNPIRTLKNGAFNYLTYLNTLELSDCEITHVEEGAFQGLYSLEWLHLDGNKLTTLRGSRLLQKTLRGLELQNNPWECDCRIVDLHTWLLDFNLPQPAEPKCKGPSRLIGRSIRSIPTTDLACLPEVSPTTFYLEISEGKNLSLLCQVRSIPEARVSWWFQGRLLQNDSLVAPGVHLTYYIEEGMEDKHSELFIYNTNTEDNGTFVCIAENAAGITQSNFTIRIIVKEEPIVIIVSFPFEYLLVVVVGAAVLLFVVLVMLLLLIARCRKNRKRQLKKDKTKEIALQYQQNTGKCSVLRENVEQFAVTLRENDCDVDCQRGLTYSPHSNDDVLRAMSPIAADNHVTSPTSLRRYQLEQNPDLINDTESGGRRREGDVEDERESCYIEGEESVQLNPTIPQSFVQIPRARGSRELYTDVHLNPNCLIDAEGYPVDYGLPKMHGCPIQHNGNFYRTLPYNRGNKRQSSITRYSRDAEFLSRSVKPPAYEHYCPGVRYTADGYPARSEDASVRYAIMSPLEDQVAEGATLSSLPCCAASGVQVQWPHCVPANLHSINSDSDYGKTKAAGKRCVGAQTDNCEREAEQSEHLTSNKTDSALDTRNDPLNEVLTESPDEGYEGEPSLV